MRQNGDEWWGLSCFNDETIPSFSVRKDPPFWYDYSSGKGGNIFSFIKEYFHCSNMEATRKLKEYAGYDGDVAIKLEKMRATRDCLKYKKKNRVEKQPKTKILSDTYMDQYEKRDGKLQIWRDEGISDASMAKFQVRYDRLSNRIVYPIRDLNGKIINIGGRTLDSAWKDKRIRKYTYNFKWGTISTIYGIAENRGAIEKSHEVVIFEGCKSVLLADTWGIPNTAAILTSHLSRNQMKILAKLGCRVVFALDKEIDVREDKNIQKLKNYVNVEYIQDKEGKLSDKESPVDEGREVFLELYNNRRKFR